MKLFLTLFSEKTAEGVQISMTRVVAFVFALGVVWQLTPDMGWPFGVLCIFVLLAIPIKDLFNGKHGYTLLGALIEKIGVGGNPVKQTSTVVDRIKAAAALQRAGAVKPPEEVSDEGDV